MTLSLGCFAQPTSSNSRWRLITTAQRDTIVQGPYREFVDFAAKRFVQDAITRTKINTIMEKNRQLRSFEIEVNALNAAITSQSEQLRKYRESNSEIQDDLDRCIEKKAGQKTWATIGKGFVVVSGLAVVGGVAMLYLSR